MEPNEQKTCHYFIDEAGDAALFDSRGRVIIGHWYTVYKKKAANRSGSAEQKLKIIAR